MAGSPRYGLARLSGNGNSFMFDDVVGVDVW